MNEKPLLDAANLTTATEKGKRPYQEDRLFAEVRAQSAFFAVLDGHGGSECAQAALEVVTEWKPLWFAEKPLEALALLVEDLDKATRNLDSGSTMSLVYISAIKQTMYCAVLGDSPILKRIGDELVIGPDHNVRHKMAERSAAENRGGVYYNGYICHKRTGNGLQMSRALGDASLGVIVSKTPEIFSWPIELGKTTIVVASDGVFEPIYSPDGPKDMALTMVELQEKSWGASELVAAALEKDLHDNATAIVFRA